MPLQLDNPVEQKPKAPTGFKLDGPVHLDKPVNKNGSAQPSTGSFIFDGDTQSELGRVTPQMRSFIPFLKSAFSGTTNVTSLMAGPHKGSAHREGRAIDLAPGFAIGANDQTRNAIIKLIQSGKIEALGTEGSVVRDPALQAVARQYNVDLFEDDVHTGATGPHFHVQLPSAGSAEARFRGQSSIFREPQKQYGQTPQEPHHLKLDNTPKKKIVLDKPAPGQQLHDASHLVKAGLDVKGIGQLVMSSAQSAATAFNPVARAGQAMDRHFAAVHDAIGAANQIGSGLFNAVLGADQRFVQGAAASTMEQGGLDAHGVAHTSRMKEIQQGIYDVLHPNSTGLLEQHKNEMEKLVHLDGLKTNDPSPTFLGRLRDFAVDTAAQNATAPSNYTGVGLARLGNSLLVKTGQLLPTLLKAAHKSGNKELYEVLSQLVPDPVEAMNLTKLGKATTQMYRERSENLRRVLKSEGSQLLAKYKRDLRKGVVPAEVEQALLRQAYVYGNANMRKEALKMGYQATAEEKAKPPENLLNYELKEDYFPHLGQRKIPANIDPLSTHKGKGVSAKAGFEKGQTVTNLPRNPYNAMQRRFDMAADTIAQRKAVKDIGETMSLPVPNFGGKKTKVPTLTTEETEAQTAIRAKYISGSVEEMKKSLFDPNTWIEKIPGLTELSKAQRDSLISIPFAHIKNIGILLYLSGGEGGLARAAYYAKKGIPKDLQARLEGGASSHFGLQEYSPLGHVPEMEFKVGSKKIATPEFSVPSPVQLAHKIPGVKTFMEKGNQALDKWDQASRAARLFQIDKEYGDTISEAEKLQMVRQDLGDYNNVPGYVKLAKAMGGEFPQWHAYIVPTAISRALLRAPQRVERLARAEALANQDLVPKDAQYQIDLGGPSDEGSDMYSGLGQFGMSLDPHALMYWASPSFIGPGGEMIKRMGDRQGGKKGLISNALDSLWGIAPFRSVIEPVVSNAYHSKADAETRALAGLFAGRVRNKPSAGKDAMEKWLRENPDKTPQDYQFEQTQLRQDLQFLRRHSR